MLFLGLLCAKKERIITRQLTFAANLVTINKVSVREWRNGRRAGFRHQFQRSEGSTPFSRIKNGPKPHAWGHFLSCGEEGPNSTAARRRQAISPAGCCLVRGFHPVGMSTEADAVAQPQAHAWGHFLSCGEEGPNSTAARRRQAISPAISRRVCQRGLTNTHRIPIL